MKFPSNLKVTSGVQTTEDELVTDITQKDAISSVIEQSTMHLVKVTETAEEQTLRMNGIGARDGLQFERSNEEFKLDKSTENPLLTQNRNYSNLGALSMN